MRRAPKVIIVGECRDDETITAAVDAAITQHTVYTTIHAGRIADTGTDPVPLMREAVGLFRDFPGTKILWASPREALNIYQADACGCHIITATNDLIQKLQLHEKSPEEFCAETVKMFYDDGVKAGFRL